MFSPAVVNVIWVVIHNMMLSENNLCDDSYIESWAKFYIGY